MKTNTKITQSLQLHIEAVERHFALIRFILNEIKDLIPFTKIKVENMTNRQKIDCDSLVHRFSLIQDTTGDKIFPLFLEIVKEKTVGLTFIDKLHLLERLQIIDDAYEWTNIRDVRNEVSHVYELVSQEQADSLNDVCKALPVLEKCFEKVKQKIANILLAHSDFN